jgi:hypothetical protein
MLILLFELVVIASGAAPGILPAAIPLVTVKPVVKVGIAAQEERLGFVGGTGASWETASQAAGPG